MASLPSQLREHHQLSTQSGYLGLRSCCCTLVYKTVKCKSVLANLYFASANVQEGSKSICSDSAKEFRASWIAWLAVPQMPSLGR